MTADLSERPNIGKDTESRLIKVGISSFAELVSAENRTSLFKASNT